MPRLPCECRSPAFGSVTVTNMMFITPMPPHEQADRGHRTQQHGEGGLLPASCVSSSDELFCTRKAVGGGRRYGATARWR